MMKVHRKLRPKNLPSIFPGIPSSCLSTQKSRPRKTSRCQSEICDPFAHQMEELNKMNTLANHLLLNNIRSDFTIQTGCQNFSDSIVIEEKLPILECLNF